jgi:Protein kinase domain/Kinase associated domain 1
MAPELFVSKRNGKSSTPLDVFAADIWAVGCIAFLMLTGSTPFPDLRQLMFYAGNQDELPISLLEEHQVSIVGQHFISSLLARFPEQRPKAEDTLNHEWIAHLSVEADTGSSVAEDSEPAVQAQSQAEHHTATFLTEDMQSWTTKPAEEPFPRDKSASVHRNPDEILAISHHQKLIDGVAHELTTNSQPRGQSAAGAILRRISTRRRKVSPSKSELQPPKSQVEASERSILAPSPRPQPLLRRISTRRQREPSSEPEQLLPNTAVRSPSLPRNASIRRPSSPAHADTRKPSGMDLRLPRTGFSERRPTVDNDISSLASLDLAGSHKQNEELLTPPSGSDTFPRRYLSLRRAASVDRRRIGRRSRPELNSESPPLSSSGSDGTTDEKNRDQPTKVLYAAAPKASLAAITTKTLGYQRRESIQARRAKREKARELDFGEDIDLEPIKSNRDLEHIGDSLKPVSLKGLFSVSTTSSKSLPLIRNDIIRVLGVLSVSYTKIKGGFHCRRTMMFDDGSTTAIRRNGGPNVRRRFVLVFDVFVVKVPLLALHGIQFNTEDKNINHYKETVQQILSLLSL